MNDDEIRAQSFRSNLFNGINLAFLDCSAARNRDVKPQGTVLLIHGFPETSYEWRAVIPLLTARGYRVIAPDYRGAGDSSKPGNGFTKTSMAADMIMLLDGRGIRDPVHVVGHNIGGAIAFALASRWPDRVASLCMSECLLPGTDTFDEQVREHPSHYFHHTFHTVDNLPESLVAGRERTYIEFFVAKLCYRRGAFSPEVFGRYADAYAQPGALRCAFDLYRAFEKDAEDLIDWIRQHGKYDAPVLILSGEYSSGRSFATRMAWEVASSEAVQAEVVEDAGHFVPEENPRGFAQKLLAFLREV